MRAWIRVGIATLLLGVATLGQTADLPKQGKYTGKFGWYATGKVFELEKDHIYWVGEFSGTIFNDAGSGFMHMASVVCPGAERHPSRRQARRR